MQNATPGAGDRNIVGLDLIRCVAAFLVAGFHLTRTLPSVSLAFPFGWVGVEIFFVISGIVIAYSAQHGDPVRFLRSRLLRLYPTAWLVAAISFSIVAIVPAYRWRAIGVSVFTDPVHLVNSLALTGIGVSGSYWTLPVELAFYACMLLLLAGRKHWLPQFGLALTLIGTPYMVLLGLHHLRVIDAPWIDFGLGPQNALLLRHGPFFALGLFLFAGLRQRWSAGLALLLCAIEIACRASEQVQTGSVSEHVLLPVLIAQTEIVFGFALLAVVASLRWNAAFPQRLRRHTRTLGLATYPFYLLHEVLGEFIVIVLLRAGATPAVAVSVAIAGVGVVAYAVSAWMEPVLHRGLLLLLTRRRSTSLGAA